jgi:hypothetical protein
MMKVLPCSCHHEYQDKKYGKQLRAHNYSLKDKGWRCTVCGKMKA